jgi:hypothetical protein
LSDVSQFWEAGETLSSGAISSGFGNIDIGVSTFTGAGTGLTGTAASLTASNVTTNANLTGMITSVGNTASLGSFTSANLASALTNQTGSGLAVFATAPTFTTQITTPAVTSAGALALFATGSNSITASTNAIERLRITAAGNVGIGTTTPSHRLTVFDTVADAQFSLAYDGSRFANFQVDSAGTLILTSTGQDVQLSDDNLWVCEAGSCPAITASSTAGYGIFENGVYFGNGFKIDQTSSSSAELGVYDDAGAIILIFD